MLSHSKLLSHNKPLTWTCWRRSLFSVHLCGNLWKYVFSRRKYLIKKSTRLYCDAPSMRMHDMTRWVKSHPYWAPDIYRGKSNSVLFQYENSDIEFWHENPGSEFVNPEMREFLSCPFQQRRLLELWVSYRGILACKAYAVKSRFSFFKSRRSALPISQKRCLISSFIQSRSYRSVLHSLQKTKGCVVFFWLGDLIITFRRKHLLFSSLIYTWCVCILVRLCCVSSLSGAVWQLTLDVFRVWRTAGLLESHSY